MKIKVNLWSFTFSFVCIGLFFIAVSSSKVVYYVTNLAHIHPLIIVLIISFTTFIFGLIGFSEANNWKLLLRSILTGIITLALSALILFSVLLANWIPFT